MLVRTCPPNNELRSVENYRLEMQGANPLGCLPGQIRAVCSQSKLIAEEGVQTCQSAQKLEDKLTDHSSLIMSHILNDDLQTFIILYSSVTHNVMLCSRFQLLATRVHDLNMEKLQLKI